MADSKRKNYWRADSEKSFKIDERVVSSYFNATQSLLFKHESAEKEESILLPLIQPIRTSRVLDLGCGNGRWGAILIPQCREYVGVDLSSTFIEKAKKKYGGKNAVFVSMAAQDYVVERNFDVILAIGLTTYMNDEGIVSMAQHCNKMLAPKGKMILRSLLCNEPGIPRKVFHYRPNAFLRLFGKHEYQIIRRSEYEETSFFKKFKLLSKGKIDGTGYSFFVFGHREDE